MDIGTGTGFLPAILKQKGYAVKSLDVNPNLNPDIVGSITSIPLKDSTFDIVSAFQVLEHLEFDNFERSISEMARVSKRYVVLSLPYFCLYLGIGMLPFRSKYLDWIYIIFNKRSASLDIVNFDISIQLTFMGKVGMVSDHKWELGRKGFPKSKVESVFSSKGLKIIKSFHRQMYPYHFFYLLEKVGL